MYAKKEIEENLHSEKSIQIWSFFWSVFFRIQTEYSCTYSVRMLENMDQKNSEFGHFRVVLKLFGSVRIEVNSSASSLIYTLANSELRLQSLLLHYPVITVTFKYRDLEILQQVHDVNLNNEFLFS